MQDDQDIVDEVLAGRTEAFRVLVERYQQAVYGFLRNMLRNVADVEDVAQDVFLKAYRSLGTFDPGKGRWSTWLLTIARNLAINALQARRTLHTLEEAHLIQSRGPQSAAADREFSRCLDEALEELPIDQRTAFVLAEMQELPYSEIASIEGIEVGTVKSRVSRARERLRQALHAWKPDAAASPSSGGDS
jgi:RNA polymerase sigma-70 factor (ECF subfamily)